MNAFSDFHETIENITTEGDKVWVHFKVTGTHTGEYKGNIPLIGKITLPSTGKKFTFTAVIIYRMSDGKIAEKEAAVYDFLDFYNQIGVIEYTGTGKQLAS
jgi:predicted ester cyclase